MTDTPTHFIELTDFEPETIRAVVGLAQRVQANPAEFRTALAGRVLLIFLSKPSLRTRIGFEAGIAQLGGHAIHYAVDDSPLGSGKESLTDTARTASRMIDVIVARVHDHQEVRDLAAASRVPVINGLTNTAHPCQALADLFTLQRHLGDAQGSLAGRKLTFCGDGHNNVTHSLLIAAGMFGMHIRVACPPEPEFTPLPRVVDAARRYAEASGGSIEVLEDPVAAVTGADAVYTDAWMSYHTPKEIADARRRSLGPYRITEALLAHAADDVKFLHCLPADREAEVEAAVIDGPRSIVFEQAENRLHTQKALLLWLLDAAYRA